MMIPLHNTWSAEAFHRTIQFAARFEKAALIAGGEDPKTIDDSQVASRIMMTWLEFAQPAGTA